MKNLMIGVGVGVVTTLCAGAALAEPFAAHGTFAVGAENIFGIDYASITAKDRATSVEGTSSTTSISLLGHMPTGDSGAVTIRSIPRLSMDVFLGPGVSIGGGLMYQHVGNSRKAPGDTTTNDGSDSYYLFAPRVGFGVPITERLAIWPRVGISYLYSSGESTNVNNAGVATTTKSTYGMWFTTLDALLLISPVEHVAFNVGPALDILIGGPTETRDGVGVATNDVSMYSIGLNAGLTVWF